MNNDLFFSFITALLICMALVPPLRFLAGRFHFMDQPGERKVHQHPIPRVGGIAFAIGALGSILWWGPKGNTTLAVLLGGLIILGFGVWDDRANLGYRIKLLGQLVAALTVILIGGIRFESIPFLLDAELPMWIGIPVTVLFLVAVSNAVNLTDGLDGLAGGLSFLTFCGMAYLAYLSNNSTVVLLAVPFLGGLLGFLRFNTYPARIFMGDSGSQLLGFIMGVLAILLTDSSSGPFSPFLSLFLLGLPFLDTLGVSVQRLVEGRSPFIGDRKHLHHKLMKVGLSHYEAVTVIYALQAGMVGLAYLLRWQSDTLIVPLYLILAGAVLALFVAAGHGLIPSPTPQSVRVRSDRWLSDLLNSPWLRDLPIRFLTAVVPLFLIATVFLPAQVPRDVGYLSTALFAILLIGLSFFPRLAPYFVRGGLYMGSTFLFYFSDASWMQAVPLIKIIYHLLFGAIAVMALLSMRFDSQSRFQTTPLDYLVVCLAIIFPFLPEVSMDISSFGLFAAKLIVLFFSFELLLHTFADRVKQLGLVSLWVLFGLGIRMWL
jgi:UDP-GlcNAc:undecaprenyl-phosphate/decaprenyl-phosphate GlcNAc-1-phosphate transferase